MVQLSLLSTPTEPNTVKITLDVGGMKCASCVRTVEKQLTAHPGVKNALVNLVTEVAVVECEDAVKPIDLANRLTAAGFTTQPRINTSALLAVSDQATQQNQEKRSQLWRLAIAMILIILSAIGHLAPNGEDILVLNNIWFHCGLATVALFGPGRPILVDGWRGAWRKSPNMNTLVGMGTVTAYSASLIALLFPQLGWECFFDEPVMMLGFILLGRTLEQQARGRAAAAFRQLLSLQPQTARLIANPPNQNSRSAINCVEIPADQVRVGEWLQVLPGEKIPVDGEISVGQTTINESMLTGESVPILKRPGDLVIAGTLNQTGAITIRATRTGKDTTLAQIVTLIEAAQTRKAPVQKLVDTVAGYFTYGVLAASVATFIFWYFFGTHIWHEVTMSSGMLMHHSPLHTPPNSVAPTQHLGLLLSLKLAIAVMVVACPCALGLATPTAILVGTGIGAERGLLIKGGDVLEQVHQLNTVVFDKTGTLTTGHPTVTDCLLIPPGVETPGYSSPTPPLGLKPQAIPQSSHSLLQIAAAVESGTIHPVATAIKQEAQRQELDIPTAVDFYTEPGLGVSAVVEGNLVLLGNSDWLTQQKVAIPQEVINQAENLFTDGKTVVYVAVNTIVVGLIAVRDTLRPEAKATVDQLRALGLRVMLLTGDRLEATGAIAKQLGLDSIDVRACVRPDQKAAVIQSLQQGDSSKGSTRRSIVAMVGDGINDAPALSQADVGIALHAGTEVAMDTAQIVLMRSSLTDVVESIKLSRATFNKIRQNLFWAFAYNTLGIPIAAGVLLPSIGFVLSPAGAGALMAFSSVSVVTNSLLLRFSQSARTVRSAKQSLSATSRESN